MTTRLTSSLVVCAAAAVFTAGALLLNRPAASPPAVAAPVTAATKPTAAGATLSIKGFAYTPLTAKPGAKITIANGDVAGHTVTSSTGLFDVSVKGTKQAELVAPTKPGTYDFVCTIHPTMQGRLVVKA